MKERGPAGAALWPPARPSMGSYRTFETPISQISIALARPKAIYPSALMRGLVSPEFDAAVAELVDAQR